MKPPYRLLFSGLLALTVPLALAVFAGPAGPILNPTFVDADGDRFPEGWSAAPSGDGFTRILASSPEGGLRIKDGDPVRAVGIEQWARIEEGIFYTARVEVSGEGTVILALAFAEERPEPDAAEAGKSTLAGKSARAEAGRIAEIVAAAPSGARWARLALLSSKKAVADVVVRFAELRPATSATSDSIEANGGTVKIESSATVDFESGDLSQIRSGVASGEGIKLVPLTDGPVRDGNFSAKIELRRGLARSEIPVLRSAPSGVSRHGWSLYLPPTFDARSSPVRLARWDDKGTGRPFTVGQKAADDPTSLAARDGNYVFFLRRQSDTGSNAEIENWELGPIEADLGQWTDWVLEVNWQPPGHGGWLRLFKNDRLVLSHEGTTYYGEKSSGPLFIVGLDKGVSKWFGEPAGAVIYVDAIRMHQSETSGYDSVAPSAVGPRPRTK